MNEISDKARELLALLRELETAGYLQPITHKPAEVSLLDAARQRIIERQERQRKAADLIREAEQLAQRNKNSPT